MNDADLGSSMGRYMGSKTGVGHTDLGFSKFLSVLPDECWDGILRKSLADTLPVVNLIDPCPKNLKGHE